MGESEESNKGEIIYCLGLGYRYLNWSRLGKKKKKKMTIQLKWSNWKKKHGADLQKLNLVTCMSSIYFPFLSKLISASD